VSFENPRLLAALFALVPALVIILLHFRVKFPLVKKMADGGMVPDTGVWHHAGDGVSDTIVKQSGAGRRFFVCSLFFLAFAALLIIALAGPHYGTRLIPEIRQGLDVVFAFDISRSMDVRDLPPFAGNSRPSRLERSLRTAGALLQTAPAPAGSIRFAAAIGKGTGTLAVPLSADTEAVLALLDGLSSVSMTSAGTNLENLIDAALAAFDDTFPTERLLILFTDGEALSGSLSAAFERAAQKRVRLIAAGAGSEAGGPVSGTEGPVISRLRPDALRAALAAASGIRGSDTVVSDTGARHSGNTYIDGNTDEAIAALGGIITAFAESAGKKTGVSLSYREESRPVAYLFILAALCAFALSALARVRQIAGGIESRFQRVRV
jgi:Ca-activated chloride channel family protein